MLSKHKCDIYFSVVRNKRNIDKKTTSRKKLLHKSFIFCRLIKY